MTPTGAAPHANGGERLDLEDAALTDPVRRLLGDATAGVLGWESRSICTTE